MKKSKKLEVMFEFLVFGIVVGIIEDALAVWLTTGESITWSMFGIIILIAVPFAVLGEIFADNINFSKFFAKFTGENKKKKK